MVKIVSDYLHIGVRSALLVLLVIRAMPHAMRQRDEQQVRLSRFFFYNPVANEGSPVAVIMPMNIDLDKIALKVVADLKAIMSKYDIDPHVYVGKTHDFGESWIRHQEEGYPVLLQIAIGTPKQIATLESSLSDLLRNDASFHCTNENGGSAGNPDADKLYICIDESYDSDPFYDADQDILLDKKYPISLDSKDEIQ